jgi:hypothetical protein
MREELVLGMQDAFSDVATVRYFIEFRLQQDPDDFFPRGVGKSAGIQDLVRDHNAGGRVEVLTEALRNSPQANGPRLGPVLDHIDELRQAEVPWEAPADPFDAFFVSGGRPFIDRNGIRDHLRASLKHGSGPRVVVISGERPCGKSWSWHYLSYLESKLEGFRTAKIDLAKVPPPPTAYEVMRRIANRLGLEAPDIDRTAKGPTQAAHLVEWFAGRVAEGKARYVLTLDSLDHTRLPDETEDLIDGLAQEAADQGDPLRFALVLLGPRFDLSGIDKFVLGEEELRPPAEDDVRSFLDRLGEHRKKPLPPETIDQLVAAAFADPPAEPIQAMSRISQQVAQFARAYFSTPAPA